MQQALPIEERAYGTVHPKVAVVLGLLVDEEERQGKLDKAESDLIRMLSIERTVYGEKHPSVTTVMANLANLYLEKKQYVRAEKLYREVVQRFTDEFSAEHVNTGIVQIKLGLVLLKERRYQDAVAHSSAGYSILSKQTSPAMKFRRLACEDLVTEYKALHQPEQAKQFQAELTAAHQ